MDVLKKHPVVGLVLIVFVLVAVAQEPTQSADAVSRAWSGISSGAGDFMDGFFTFVNDL